MAPVLPGSTLGVMGGGQLGRMLLLAARALGYQAHVFDPEADCPAGQVADRQFTAPYNDEQALVEFAKSVNVVTLEFENVPSRALEVVNQHVAVHPGPAVLHVTQNRLREKDFLSSNGFPVTPYRKVITKVDLETAGHDLGYPFILKTAGSGYDGKGQIKLNSEKDLDAGMKVLGCTEGIAEKMVPFVKEVSVVGARGQDGSFAHYGLIENEHRNHILDFSIIPARVDKAIADKGVKLAQDIMRKLNGVGVMCTELFLLKDGSLLVNELAPRPHNSGHFSIDACITSQFEQQLRAVCGLPLGSTAQRSPAAMANLLGDLWEKGEPDWTSLLALSQAKLHLYGKKQARPGRKMGHVTVWANSGDEALQKAKEARDLLTKKL